MTVFANGLEISAQAQGAKVIAAFPDVCFTPPQTPATPPGVPIPYPNFGMDSDLASGSGTVKIGGKPVSQENSSNYKKISGDEAGAAPKKSVITSKNMGKAYAQMWSMDVKVEGKGTVRFSDIMTTNHSSNPGSSPPWPAIAKMNVAGGDCEVVYADLQGHAHEDSPCDYSTTGKESEHTDRAAAFMHTRGSKNCSNYPDYNEKKAPCICMEAKRMKKKADEPSKKGMPHYNKTKKVNDFLDKHRKGCMSASGSVSCKNKCTVPTVGELTEVAKKATVEEHPKTKDKSKKEKKQIGECLELINITYIGGVNDKDSEDSAKEKVEATKKKPICAKGVCKGPKSKKCFSCGK